MENFKHKCALVVNELLTKAKNIETLQFFSGRNGSYIYIFNGSFV